ncbi:hypothetical protein B0J11DRAFT_595255 [Dendryphion nanum]|uniref:J domain-containing protein n=1 Tax=Dendryphion nanum TaxID=256645 RepID=A0A9P9D7E2_9PLEO|nr:hypothetical protein B0J11DRAFT_595255 [Dendryphion nanum]
MCSGSIWPSLELRKFYRSDRYRYTTNTRSGQAALERFYLIVDAHNNLSDPMKRRAYDMYEHGWRSGLSAFQKEQEGPYDSSEYYDQQLDEYNKKQEEYFVRNVLSAIIMLLRITLTSYSQLTRAGKVSRESARKHLERHQAIAADLRQLYNKTAPMNKDDRMKRFLVHRETQDERRGGEGRRSYRW